jgi:hypothetical protein
VKKYVFPCSLLIRNKNNGKYSKILYCKIIDLG